MVVLMTISIFLIMILAIDNYLVVISVMAILVDGLGGVWVEGLMLLLFIRGWGEE